MLEYRMLTDFDMDKIVEYSNEYEFVDNKNLYVSERFNIEPFKKESSLRPILFDGRIIMYAEVDSNTIKKATCVSLPDLNTKSRVISILYMSTDNHFIKKAISFLETYFMDSAYSKIRLAYYEKEYNKSFAVELIDNGFKCEADFSSVLNNKKILCLKLDKEI